MGILNKIFGQKNHDKKLEGLWESDLQDEKTKESIGNVRMNFKQDGKLVYDIIEDSNLQRIIMVYWTNGDILYSDQASSPKVESTKYKFENYDSLVLEFDGKMTKFNRSK